MEFYSLFNFPGEETVIKTFPCFFGGFSYEKKKKKKKKKRDKNNMLGSVPLHSGRSSAFDGIQVS